MTKSGASEEWRAWEERWRVSEWLRDAEGSEVRREERSTGVRTKAASRHPQMTPRTSVSSPAAFRYSSALNVLAR